MDKVVGNTLIFGTQNVASETVSSFARCTTCETVVANDCGATFETVVGSEISLLTKEELIFATAGFAIEQLESDVVFISVATDSRNVSKNTLFVPLIGEKQDGHKYIYQAVENGASVVFISEDEARKNACIYKDLVLQKKVFVVCVKNTLKALQNIASFYVKKFPNLTKIAITGSSGKTTTKELAVSVLKQKFKTVYTEGNFNSETGLPLSVFKIRHSDEVGLFEMGMNHKNEIADLIEVFPAKYAIITNIGTAHIGLLGSKKNIAEEKRKVFSKLGRDGVAFIPLADEFAKYLSENIVGKVVYYGQDVLDNGISDVKFCGIDGTYFSLNGLSIHLKLPGTYNFYNALSVIALARELCISDDLIKKGLEEVCALNGRSEILNFVGKFNNKITVLKDCYNANPDSMEKALMLCTSVAEKRCIVLGDMLELGNESKKSHSAIGELCVNKFNDKKTLFVFIGQEMKNAFEIVKRSVPETEKVFYSALYDEQALKSIVEDIILSEKDDLFILLKASHGIGLERVCKILQEKIDERL